MNSGVAYTYGVTDCTKFQTKKPLEYLPTRQQGSGGHLEILTRGPQILNK